MNIKESIKLLIEKRGFQVEEVTYKYRVSDEDGAFTFDTDGELIDYALEQEKEIYL